MNMLPTELQEHVLSFLPIAAQVTAAEVCCLWRTLLTSPKLRKSRYQEFAAHHRTVESPQPNSKRSEFHQLLYNPLSCGATCSCVQRTDIRYRTLDRTSYWTDFRNHCNHTFLTAIPDPLGQSPTEYELWTLTRPFFQNASGTRRNTDFMFHTDSYHRIPLSPTHPFWDEPFIVLSNTGSGGNEAQVERISLPIMQLAQIGDPSQPNVTIGNNSLWVSRTDTVRQFVLQAQKMMNRPAFQYIQTHMKSETVKSVRFYFVSNFTAHGGEVPVLELSLEKGYTARPDAGY
ncbi:hypothetical protein TWF281_004884 [Arthrobotrys megalospora]